ncbi:MAG TPA: hypothetical protein PK631_06120 [Erysipelotrichaceae bacterium]|nr:hypothetical protein [Erysipelotrichaceae bacterium]
MDSKDLIEKIQEEFSRRFKEKEDFSDYKQVQNYAVEIAEKSAKAVINNFDESLINEFGTLDYDILNEVLSRILESDYKLIADACVTAQTEMNKNANIGLKAIAPKYDDDRAHSIVWDMAQRDLESFKQAYPEYTDNFYQSTVDEAVRANADFQWKSGLEPKVTRLAKHDCCKWCQSLEGTYRYEDVSDSGNDVWRRHRNCRCLIVYAPGKGKAKDVRTRKPVDDEEVQKRLDFVKEQENKIEEKPNIKIQKYDEVNKTWLTIDLENYDKFKHAYQESLKGRYRIDTTTQKLLKEAMEAEPKITKDLLDIISRTKGTIDYEVIIDGEILSSLDFRLKEYNSLRRKVISEFVEGKPLGFIETHLYDSVRFTDLIDDMFFTNEYFEVKSQLENLGYEFVRVKNTIGDTTEKYRGINVVVESPSGYKFELQFHTPQSLDIKNRNHILYELERKDTTSFEEKIKLSKQMLLNSQELNYIPDCETMSIIWENVPK